MIELNKLYETPKRDDCDFIEPIRWRFNLLECIEYVIDEEGIAVPSNGFIYLTPTEFKRETK